MMKRKKVEIKAKIIVLGILLAIFPLSSYNKFIDFRTSFNSELNTSATVWRLWRIFSTFPTKSSPALGDIDGDGKLEVVLGGGFLSVIALNGEDGSSVWSYHTEGFVDSSPALGDIDGDGMLEVVVGSNDKYVYALNGGDGSVLWKFKTGGIVYSSPALGDVDGDEKLEVVVGSKDGNLYTLNGEDGSIAWITEMGGPVYSSPALGDVDGDGKLEVIIGSIGFKVYALNGEDGSELWKFKTLGHPDMYSSPALADVDGDGKLEVIVGKSDSRVYAINGEDGSIAWGTSIPWLGESAPALGDVDGDGKLEVIIASSIQKLYALNGENGSIEWIFKTESRFISSPALGDVDGDGKLEVIIGSYDDWLYVLNGKKGSISWKYNLQGKIYSSPVIGNVKGAGGLEVIIRSQTAIYALRPSPSGEIIQWQGLAGEDFHRKKALTCDLLDLTPPMITIEYQDGDGTDGNPGKWNFFAYDDESGVNEDTINVSIDGEFTGDTFGEYVVPNNLDEHTIRVEVENNDGILGSEFDSVIIIDDDTSNPVIDYIYTGDGTDGNSGEIIVTTSDDSGLSVDPSGTYSVPNSLGTHNFIFTATDNDNDRVDDTLTTTRKISRDIIDDDSTSPEILIDYTGSGLDSNPGYFEWNVFDLDSGISEINITISYESSEGLDDYVISLVGTEAGSWVLPPNLGIYTLEISARDNDDDRTLIIDSLTTELTRDQEIVDDDVVSPELSNLIIIPSIFEINVTFDAIDESGIEDISTFINGELVEPITQFQYGNTYSFSFENQWFFQSGTSEVVIQVEDGDDDRPNDALASSITGTFENILYPTFEYIIWQLEELMNYIDENLCQHVVRSLNRKLTQAQDQLYKAFNYFENGNITCALFHDFLAKLFVRFTEHRTEIFNRKGLIEDYHTKYIIDSLHEIRNNIVLLMGASTGEIQAYKIALIEVELLNLKDFIEDQIPCCLGRCLSAKISCSAKLLELALFKISMGYSIDCILEYAQCKLEHTITKINFLLEKGKIPEDVANYLIDKISSIIGDLEQLKNN